MENLTISDVAIVLGLALNTMALLKFWVSWERRMTTIETYMRLIMPKLGINLVDANHRRTDHFGG